MLDIIQLLTFTWLTMCALFAIIKLSQNSNNSIYFVLIIYYIFYGVPIFLDLFYGKPAYNSYPALQISINDEQTTYIYCIFISIVPLVWLLTKGRKIATKSDLNRSNTKIISWLLKPALYILIISPLFGWIFAPNPSVYLTYGAVAKHLLITVEENLHNELLVNLTLVSILSGAILLLLGKRIGILNLMSILPWMFLSCWLNGKRTYFVLTVFLIIFAFWQKGYLKGWKLWIVGSFVITSVALFSVWYQDSVRGEFLETQSQEQIYDHVRVDFGRDDRLKMVIYYELHPDMPKILEHRGQTALFYLVTYVPRSLWPEKPWPYSVYLTSAIFMKTTTYFGWGVTTSWLDEMIANFSWFGMLIGPLSLAYLCKVGDSIKNIWIRPLTLLISCLFLAVQLSMFMPLFLLWILLVVWEKRKRTRTDGTSQLEAIA